MLKDLFLSMDDDGSGMLEEPEIKMLAIALGQKLSPNEIRAGMRPSLGSAACPPAGTFVTSCANRRNCCELIDWGQLWLRWTRTVRAKLILKSSMSGGLVIRKRAQCSRQGQMGHLQYITKSSRTIEPLACRWSATIPAILAGSEPHHGLVQTTKNSKVKQELHSYTRDSVLALPPLCQRATFC